MSVKIPALNSADSAGEVEVSEDVFGREYNEALVHQLATKALAGLRSGTKAQKNRAAVSGGGAKPWKQKGSGRARSGTIRSPLWRSGGVTFAAQPRSFDQKLNKKMYRAGIRSILSELLRQNRLVASSDIMPTTPKTKELVAKLKGLSKKRVLIIADELTENIYLSSRNVVNLEVTTANELDPVMLIAADNVIATPAALKAIEAQLS
ncbi:large subunit ribosomal protein L4 [Bathymodiolus platifrons methanotrophic gill symbiont]|uniref:50S ribosomal protein L4 n=1 Tax=Bathymodiolus platifrons methanotrophic gill symbiont TaxID=113268 RepID=UPI000B4112EB|nr:50S ribosomal protein L4 [Bathymodiolus platifrons methanotrophic gill symbiont]MCK5869077.1 50S ribosomal protein L4 [Methyloprofundus sp.]TXK97414.1 50S ribosomal protein L4 [Methylococcaceae bacterium CS4]TXK99736.1 50S ribosomal protein L4 [Methylococcaceae bacterium CS5]TXL06584.1 50S ribosomal protein L4 [Methylococcaceae bacterium CS1]TXL09525.1 50S ribosomal protein L4 [Methylococcaceae bacterium CS3]TXL12163.1 50S ribosomal protein L4 [Methylococcaceae bacterium CS2]